MIDATRALRTLLRRVCRLVSPHDRFRRRVAARQYGQFAAQYLERVRAIQDILPMSGAERDMAERFASIMSVMRLLPLEPALLRMLTAPSTTIEEKWRSAPSLVSFMNWLREPSCGDSLMPLSGDRRAHER